MISINVRETSLQCLNAIESNLYRVTIAFDRISERRSIVERNGSDYKDDSSLEMISLIHCILNSNSYTMCQ
jgi:hypothetical protein